MEDTPFNPDELTAQNLAGGGPRGHVPIRNYMIDQHRQFFAQLPHLFVGVVDATGWPIATQLTGRPGFVQSPDPVTLRIAALPDVHDPAAGAFALARDIGILGIDFSTRRRNRANGRIVRRGVGGIDVAVSQSFGNCPQYIQRRNIQPSTLASAQAGPRETPSNSVESFAGLDDTARKDIERADTFFVASHSRTGGGAAFGADISHRGGRAGFVRIDGDVLTIPDFRGNRYFNTLGNLSVEPRASLLFIDFETGSLLQLRGRAEIDWNGAAARLFASAERLWRFHVVRGWRRDAASPLRWSFVDYSERLCKRSAGRASDTGP